MGVKSRQSRGHRCMMDLSARSLSHQVAPCRSQSGGKPDTEEDTLENRPATNDAHTQPQTESSQTRQVHGSNGETTSPAMRRNGETASRRRRTRAATSSLPRTDNRILYRTGDRNRPDPIRAGHDITVLGKWRYRAERERERVRSKRRATEGSVETSEDHGL